jgi:hypothetical protein
VTFFLDFDRTLFDVDALYDAAMASWGEVGIAREVADAHRVRLRRDGGAFTPEALAAFASGGDRALAEVLAQRYRAAYADGDRFLFADVPPALARMATLGDVVVVTMGDAEYQRSKFDATPGICRAASACVVVPPGTSKGDVVAGFGERVAVFVDDDASHVDGVMAKAPWVRGLRMDRAGNTGLSTIGGLSEALPE